MSLQVLAAACLQLTGIFPERFHSEGSVAVPEGWGSLLHGRGRRDRERERERRGNDINRSRETQQAMNNGNVHGIFTQNT